MQSILRKTTVPHGIVIAAVIGCAVLIFAFILATQAQASSPRLSAGERLITVHDRGKERGLLTHATTLRDAFKEADIEVDPNDRVEPGLDEELVATNYEVNVYRARPVTIIDGSVKKRVMSPYQTPEQIAKDADMELHDEDTTEMNASSNMVAEGTGVQLTITRATEFTLKLYGKKITAYTQAKTVGEMLEQKDITLGEKDTLSVAKSKKITAGMLVEIWRNGKQTVTEDQDVAFEVEEIQDPDHEVGYREVKTAGVKGKKTVTYEIVMKNGKEVSRKEIQSVVTKQAKKEVVVVGTKMSNSFSGSFAEALARLRSCEGSYTSNTGNGYYGAYQYDAQTWGGYKGYAVASDAPPAVQDEKAWETYQRRGWQPWPSCSISQGLQDIYR